MFSIRKYTFFLLLFGVFTLLYTELHLLANYRHLLYEAQSGYRAPPLPGQTFDELCRNLSCDPETPGNQTLDAEIGRFLSEDAILVRTADCGTYFRTVGADVSFAETTPDETAFPMAFGHSLHRDVGVLEMFFAVAFRPVDAHCIHIDSKSSDKVREAVHGFVSCYRQKFPESTLFVLDQSIPVFWGHGSILESDQMCLRALADRDDEWRVFLNPASTELPFVTVDTFRKKLRQFGANVVDIGFNTQEKRQMRTQRLVRIGLGEYDLKVHDVYDYVDVSPPCNLTVFKGYKNVALTRPSAELLVKHPVGLDFYAWIRNTSHNSEHFYNTMASVEVRPAEDEDAYVITQRFDLQKDSPGDHCYTESLWTHPGAGGCRLLRYECNMDLRKSPLNGNLHSPLIGNNYVGGLCLRKSLWHRRKCSGQSIRWICNFGVGDLEDARSSGCLMGNKFNLDVSPSAVACQVKELDKLRRMEMET